ncbi:hypothetical protein [Clostridium cochlearium]|nr:hypothetical protein [Clostridium cochlearium]
MGVLAAVIIAILIAIAVVIISCRYTLEKVKKEKKEFERVDFINLEGKR